MTTGDSGLFRLTEPRLRSTWVVLLAVAATLMAGLIGGASAAAAAPAPDGQSAAALLVHGSSYGYDHRPDYARPPSAEVTSNGYDTPALLSLAYGRGDVL